MINDIVLVVCWVPYLKIPTKTIQSSMCLVSAYALK